MRLGSEIVRYQLTFRYGTTRQCIQYQYDPCTDNVQHVNAYRLNTLPFLPIGIIMRWSQVNVTLRLVWVRRCERKQGDGQEPVVHTRACRRMNENLNWYCEREYDTTRTGADGGNETWWWRRWQRRWGHWAMKTDPNGLKGSWAMEARPRVEW